MIFIKTNVKTFYKHLSSYTRQHFLTSLKNKMMKKLFLKKQVKNTNLFEGKFTDLLDTAVMVIQSKLNRSQQR